MLRWREYRWRSSSKTGRDFYPVYCEGALEATDFGGKSGGRRMGTEHWTQGQMRESGAAESTGTRVRRSKSLSSGSKVPG